MNKTNIIAKLWNEIKSYFNISQDMVSQSDAEQEIRSGVSFKGSQLLILIFAIFVASLGLNTNSAPVVIGAMLISPLMGPIYGMGLGMAIGDFGLLRRGFKNIAMAVLGSLIASALYFWISPVYENSSQLLARTSPGIYDVLIALFGGAAGMVSIGCKNKGQVMPGVAIATSLMPPLCTAGYGLATWQLHYFLGALYLFFINTVFILFASWIVLRLMGYRHVVYQDAVRARRVQIAMYSIVTLTVAVSIYLTVGMIQKSRFMASAADFVNREMVFPNTQVLKYDAYIKGGKRHIDVNLIGQTLPKDSLMLALMTKMDSVGLGGTILNIKQGFGMSALTNVNHADESGQIYQIMQNEIMHKNTVIDSLHQVVNMQELYQNIGQRISPELKVLFPGVQSIAMTRMVLNSVQDSALCDTLTIAFVQAPYGLGQAENSKLQQYLAVRLNAKHLQLMVNPAGMPWPQP